MKTQQNAASPNSLPPNAAARSRCDWEPGELRAIVDKMTAVETARDTTRELSGMPVLPSRDAIAQITELLRSALFPCYFGVTDSSADSIHYHIGSTLDTVLELLKEQVRRSLCFASAERLAARDASEAEALRLTKEFIKRLPEVKRLLETDVQAACDGDPAATGADEVIICYPGFRAIKEYRLAHVLHRLGVPLIPRMITEQAHSITGIDIHPEAAIGESFFIDHGTGVVIGQTCIIGKRVRIYQGVTLGAKSLPFDKEGKPIHGVPRHPIVEDDVVIYSGATILGRVTIGKGSIIGGNVWLTESVSPGSKVIQSPARQEVFAMGAGI